MGAAQSGAAAASGRAIQGGLGRLHWGRRLSLRFGAAVSILDLTLGVPTAPNGGAGSLPLACLRNSLAHEGKREGETASKCAPATAGRALPGQDAFALIFKGKSE